VGHGMLWAGCHWADRVGLQEDHFLSFFF